MLAWFAVRRRQFRTMKQVATNIVLPVIGMALTGLLWSFLHADALISGLVWVSVGVIYAVVLTKVTGKRLADLGMRRERGDGGGGGGLRDRATDRPASAGRRLIPSGLAPATHR